MAIYHKAFNTIRRKIEQLADQFFTVASRLGRLGPPVSVSDTGTRVAILTVNFSTGRYLKLLLLTLAEQSDISALRNIVITDNGSEDGSYGFIQALASKCSIVNEKRNERFLNHANGMRTCCSVLDESDRARNIDERANVLLFLDSDVLFCHPDALQQFIAQFDAGADFVGEHRSGVNKHPDVQASCFAVRRSIFNERGTLPLVNHGSPSYWLQRSLAWKKARVVNFMAYTGFYLLHRGRSGVHASSKYHPGHSYATVPNRNPHFMGISGAAERWQATERKYDYLLDETNEDQLVEYLADNFGKKPL